MKPRDVWDGFAGRDPTTTSLSPVIGVVVAPLLVSIATAVLDATGLLPGSIRGAAIVATGPVVLAVATAERDGGYLGAWLVGFPTFLFAAVSLSCYSGNSAGVASCAPQPLSVALLIAAVASTVVASVGVLLAAVRSDGDRPE